MYLPSWAYEHRASDICQPTGVVPNATTLMQNQSNNYLRNFYVFTLSDSLLARLFIMFSGSMGS